jgi:hypothetical protein
MTIGKKLHYLPLPIKLNKKMLLDRYALISIK